jgi:hypothetical protein
MEPNGPGLPIKVCPRQRLSFSSSHTNAFEVQLTGQRRPIATRMVNIENMGGPGRQNPFNFSFRASIGSFVTISEIPRLTRENFIDNLTQTSCDFRIGSRGIMASIRNKAVSSVQLKQTRGQVDVVDLCFLQNMLMNWL